MYSQNFFEGLPDDALGYEVFFSSDADQTFKFLSDMNNQITPAMCYYVPAKGTLVGRSSINQQYQLFCRMVRRSEQIFIIGVRVHPEDTHVWDVLRQTSATLVYFGK